MVGGIGPRLLAATLPHVDWWNTWWDAFGNRAGGLAALNARVDEACQRAGRNPREVARSVCVLVEVDGNAGERSRLPEAPPLGLEQLAPQLRALEEAGADEAILVLDPITEVSIRRVAERLKPGFTG